MEFTLLAGKIEKSTKDSAAFDLFYSGVIPIVVGDTPTLVPTGVKSSFSKGLVCIIKEKSGLGLKGIEVKAGVIDSDYDDEWKVILRNPVRLSTGASFDGESSPFNVGNIKDWEPFVVRPGMKVAQFIIVHLPEVVLHSVAGSEIIIKDVVRDGGFGSTGSGEVTKESTKLNDMLSSVTQDVQDAVQDLKDVQDVHDAKEKANAIDDLR